MSTENFELPVTFNGQELSFPAALIAMGMSYKFQVEVNGEPVFFEPDEERNFRAMIDVEHHEKYGKMNVELLKAIAESLESIVKG